MTDELREKDVAVLRAIQSGASTVDEINQKTTLTTREINYSLTEYSLEDLGLVEITRPNGREWREINGQERYVWKPKEVELTDYGLQIGANLDSNDVDKYEDMSKRELIERIQELEDRMDQIETVFHDFRTRVVKKL